MENKKGGSQSAASCTVYYRRFLSTPQITFKNNPQ